ATRAERAPVDLAAVAAARLRAWQPALPDATLTGSGVALARADVVEQILDVLLDNAAKYAAGARVTVTIGAHPPGAAPGPPGTVPLTVHDDGPGLPGDEAHRLGERFYRAPSHRRVPGTGLGLSIARTLADAADGRLEIGAPGHGFTVTLHLPAAP
ncbi:MAG TPA: sensor histidine kinase, partial [Pseudonocardiaceae bacterium]